MTEPPNAPHDGFFRENFERQAVAEDYLRQVLPSDVLAVMDLSTLTISKDTYVSKELRRSYSDLVYHVRYQGADKKPTDPADTPNEARIYLLFEHKSQADPWVALQLLHYIVQSGHAYRKQHPEANSLPPVYPIVLYHGRSSWTGARCFQQLVAPLPDALVPHVPQFCYQLHDISPRGAATIKGQVLTRLVLLALRYIYDDQPLERLRELLALLDQIADRTTALEVLESLLRYYVQVTQCISETQASALVQTTHYGESAMQTFIDKYMEQGHQQGEATILLRLMERKFGTVPENLRERIEKADAQTLLDWSERILTAATPEEVVH